MHKRMQSSCPTTSGTEIRLQDTKRFLPGQITGSLSCRLGRGSFDTIQIIGGVAVSNTEVLQIVYDTFVKKTGIAAVTYTWRSANCLEPISRGLILAKRYA